MMKRHQQHRLQGRNPVLQSVRLSFIGLALLIYFRTGHTVLHASEPPVVAQYAAGKVLSVEKHGDRFGVKITVNEGEDVEVGLRTTVYVFRDFNLNAGKSREDSIVASGQLVEVGEDGSMCNVEIYRLGKKHDRVPRTGDDVFVKRRHRDVTFIVAKNVMLHDGKIREWDDVPKILDELSKTQLIRPSLKLTAAKRDEMREYVNEFTTWCEGGKRYSYSHGSISPGISKYRASLSYTMTSLGNSLLTVRAFSLSAAAMFVAPSDLRQLMAALRNALKIWGVDFVRIRLLSSPKVTSRTQCRRFSMLQWPRHQSDSLAASACDRGTLVMA